MTRTMSPHRINHWRGILTWVLRVVAVAVAGFGAYLVLGRIVMALVTRNLEAAFQSWEEIGAGHPLYRGVALLIVSAALAVFSRAIAAWAMPAPPRGCPGCGYERVEGDRCPECGLAGFATGENASR